MPADPLAQFLAAFDPGPALAALLGAAFAAGVIRGFSGFGTAMAFMPIASAATNPVFALIAMQMMDTAPSVPLVIRHWRDSAPREILSLMAAATLTVPLGVWILKTADPITVRWMVAALIMTLVAAIASGWRYRRKPGLPVTVAAGTMSGVFGGLAALSGPPVILFWLSGQSDARRVRANMMVYLSLLTAVSITSLAIAGLFTLKAVLWGFAVMPAYVIGIIAGGKLFPLANETAFRRIALGFIAFAVLISLPLFDGVFR